MPTTPGFSKWRARLWPVHKHEHRKLIPLLIMKLCASLNYSILHSTKDTLVVTSKGSGAEVIPILKGWVVLFAALIATVIYSKLSNRLSRKQLFYAAITPFLIFFALYGFVLYPFREALTPHASADWLQGIVGANHAHWVVVYRYWMNSIFFVMSELWGGIVIALLFWGFANRINSVGEAKRFYTLFSAGGHVGVIAAGPLIWHLSRMFSADQYAMTVQTLMGVASVITLLMILMYWWTNKYAIQEEPVTQAKKKKQKLSLREGLAFLMRSPYLGLIALMVIGYGVSVSMVEVSWKAILKLKYPSSSDYQAYMGLIASCIGIVSFFLALLISGNVIRKFGWVISALATPLILGGLSVAFYFAYFSSSEELGQSIAVGAGGLAVVVAIGAIHNVACKSMKYCLFDTTKEMAYIPLDEATKVKGKAAVDVVAARFGKAGSSWMQAGLMELAGVSSILRISHWLAPFVIVAVVVWTLAVVVLNRRLKALSETHEALPAAA